MNTTIRLMQPEDKAAVMEMMQVFYASPAVLSNGSEEIFSNDIDACVSDSPYAEGYIILQENQIAGYGMIAKSYSTEFGKSCIWIEDIYLKEAFRGQEIGKVFFDFITEKYAGCIFRLEVEEENQRAIRLYKKCGFEVLPYMEMKKE